MKGAHRLCSLADKPNLYLSIPPEGAKRIGLISCLPLCIAYAFDIKVNRKCTIACYLTLAALFTFSQSVWLITVPEPAPEISGWFVGYRWTSSIESFGIAFLLICLTLLLWRFPHRVIYWLSFLLIAFVAWLYIGRELWAHFVELPKRFEGVDVSLPPYFSFRQPILAIPRVIWHILIPVSVLLAISLIIKKRGIEQAAPSDH